MKRNLRDVFSLTLLHPPFHLRSQEYGRDWHGVVELQVASRVCVASHVRWQESLMETESEVDAGGCKVLLH